MTKLSDTALVLLGKAAQRDDGLAIPPPKLPAAARNAVAKSLIKPGLLTETRVHEIVNAWRKNDDGHQFGLRITEAGFRALNLEPTMLDADVERNLLPERAIAEKASAVVHTEPQASTDAEAVQEAPTVTGALDGAHAASVADRTDAKVTLRGAAQAVLAAWDDEASGRTDIIATLEGSMAGLRALLAERAPRSTNPSAPRKPREGTKQETVLAMLRRDEGASGPQIAETTGWASHTVRGFLAGLKRKGFTIETLERVRQVGPNKAGAKGSYSIYRITG